MGDAGKASASVVKKNRPAQTLIPLKGARAKRSSEPGGTPSLQKVSLGIGPSDWGNGVAASCCTAGMNYN